MTTPAKHLPIAAARQIARTYGQRQVIVVAWDGDTTHVVTYGQSATDCDQAAAGGNKLKSMLGWPPELCATLPASTVRRMRKARAKGAASTADLAQD